MMLTTQFRLLFFSYFVPLFFGIILWDKLWDRVVRRGRTLAD